jgi:hypothetical protein
MRDEPVGCALDERRLAALLVVHGGHPLALAGEGNRADLRRALELPCAVQPSGAGEDEQRNLGGIAGDTRRTVTLLLAYLRIVRCRCALIAGVVEQLSAVRERRDAKRLGDG